MAERAGGISLHAVDIATGRVATGLVVVLRRLEPMPCTVAVGAIGVDGLLDHACARGEGIIAGVYEVEFAVQDYLAAQGRSGGFLDIVRFRFLVGDAAQHCHLPFKFTPFGFSLFRGA